MKDERRISSLWYAGLAMVTAIILVVLVSQGSTMSRLSNLGLDEGGFRDTYLMFSKSEPGKGYVLGRRDSTIRRSHKKLSGGKWNLVEIAPDPDIPGSSFWVAQSKRINRGTVFFIPVTGVSDWSYPFLYQFVKKHRRDIELPDVEWSRLFVNRIYKGLYLKVSLPFDLRKKDGGSGVLREIFTIEDNRMTYVSTRFSDIPGLYTSILADGVVPVLATPPPALSWLSQRRPADGIMFLMSNQPPFTLSLLPLPVSLPGLFEAKNGRPPATFEDGRFRQWSIEAHSSNISDPHPFSVAEMAALDTEFEQYASLFKRELQMHTEFHRSPELLEQLPERQAAIADLEPSLGKL